MKGLDIERGLEEDKRNRRKVTGEQRRAKSEARVKGEAERGHQQKGCN